ncbi:hypothetical protein IHC93_19940 [Photobacterium damselae subsp. damselae]|uniref:phage baseplate assembly protein n=1 Tax=Photobacterium damselae TaxID=38293 RepID=UPI001F29985D|nr:hypothetical protein [Photobacterium damselae]UKA27197.1 hypothetical protein IHC93_19940 [Photobacterium damselae subsp. damselae]
MYSIQSKQGDSAETISIRAYGNRSGASNIAAANPNIDFDNVPNGTMILIPVAGRIGTDTIITDDPDQVTVIVNGERFYIWYDFKITLSLDRTADTFSFILPFDPQNQALKLALMPFSYATVKIYIGSEKIITGTIIRTAPSLDDSAHVSVSGYSRCGILEDVCFSPSQYPIEYNNSSLVSIANAAIKPFGLTASQSSEVKKHLASSGSSNAWYNRTNAPVQGKIKGYLSSLAKKDGVIMSSDKDGNVLFDVMTNSKPVITIKEGHQPFLSGNANFDGKKLYSHFTGFSQDWLGESYKTTVVNESVASRGVFRPYTVVQSDIDSGNLRTSIQSIIKRNSMDAISLNLNLSTWRDDNKKLLYKNKNIFLYSPSLMIFKKTRMTIKEISFGRSATSKFSELKVTTAFEELEL